ncbi:MAG: hypothetical protein V3T70_11875 [Phycisphaerae bacterium]
MADTKRKTDKPRRPPPWLRALGPASLPESVELDGGRYTRVETLKHDFFAATGLYQGHKGKAIVKIGRTASLFGLPLWWLGRASMRHEKLLYDLLADLEGIPRWLGELGTTGFAHAYVEGHPMRKGEQLADAFFDQLAALIRAVHDRDAAYVDLEKRENILVGDDGRPWLIDFQISWYLAAGRGGRRWPWRYVLRVMQSADWYHFAKHLRRHRPDCMTPADQRRLARPPAWIRWHRVWFRPLTLARRRVLTWMGARGTPAGRSEEMGNDPGAALP